MESFKIIAYTKDNRTQTNVLYAQINIKEYLDLVGKDFDRFEIQRKREQHKGYNRLKRDIEKGALIPTITLAIEPSKAKNYIDLTKKKNDKEIIKLLSKDTEDIYILDGLQRTYIINDLVSSGAIFVEDQSLLLEIWIEPIINHLIYRLIVLNSGQKPMSMRHQIELLFMTMKSTLQTEMPNLKLLEEKDQDKRSAPLQFAFDRLVLSYKAFLMKSTEVDKNNIVSEQLIEDDILDSEEEFLSSSFQDFKKYLSIYGELDQLVFDKYSGSEMNKFRNWMADSNVMISFFSAASRYGSDPKRKASILQSLEKLKEKFPTLLDPINLVIYTSLKEEKANPKKYNVGYATRKLLTNGFIEYFRGEGIDHFSVYWGISASEL